MSHDVFISYCHKDNLPLARRVTPDDPELWVEWFHIRLTQYLSQILARNARVWRDRKLHNSDELSDEIRSALAASAVLVPLVSPAFASSSWCPDEVQIFLDHLRDRGVAEKAAALIHPVLKLPTATQELPSILASKLGVAFYHRDEGSDRVHQWDPTDETHSIRLNRALYSLCDDIRRAIQNDQPDPTGPLVFLPRSDREAQIPRVRKELIQLRYRLAESDHGVPSATEEGLRRNLASLLDESELVVMLPGRFPLMHAGISVERVQWEMIQARLAENRLKCLVWVDDRRVAADPDQEQWIESVGAEKGVELLRCPFQQFLIDLNSLLKSLKPSGKRATTARPLLVVDHHDSDVGHPQLTDALGVLGSGEYCEIAEAYAAGLSPSQLRQRRITLTERADGMLLFSARGSASWLRARYDETLKHRPTFGPRLYYLLAPEGADDKQALFQPDPPNFITADRPQALRDLASQLTKGGRL